MLRSLPSLFVGLAMLVAIGCAPALPDAALGPAPWSESGYGTASDGAPAPNRDTEGRRASRAARASTPELPVPRALPMNAACLRDLDRAGVSFSRGPSTRGVQTPVVIRGQLAGVNFWANDKRPLLLDCRLALALERLKPVFAEYGVTRARFSGAYVLKTTRTGRLSHHAYGLAIDIHSITMGDEEVAVQGGFLKGLGCNSGKSKLNALACELRASGYFEEFLTPDYNYDHRDHLHLAVPLEVPSGKDGRSGRLAARR